MMPLNVRPRDFANRVARRHIWTLARSFIGTIDIAPAAHSSDQTSRFVDCKVYDADSVQYAGSRSLKIY